MKKLIIILTFLCIIPLVYAAPPILEPIPSPQALTEGTPFNLIVGATDPEAGNLYFSDDTDNFDITSINSTAAEIAFTPTNEMIGSFIAVIIVRDDEDLVDAQAVVFNVNGIPVISNLEDKNITGGEQFYFDIDATDPEDGTNLLFSDDSPLFNIDVNTGEINFLTQETDAGYYNITITANDSLNAFGIGNFELAINDEPNITQIPQINVFEDENFELNISNYTDNIVGSLTFYDNSSFLDIDPSTGIINHTPNITEVGINGINISVEDIYGLYDENILILNVTEINDAPYFSTIPYQIAKIGGVFHYDVNATDEEGNDIYYYDNSDLFNISESTGLINFSVNSSMAGIYDINISVNDTLGAFYVDNFTLEIIANLPPLFPKNLTTEINPIYDTHVNSSSGDSSYYGSELLYLSNLVGEIKRTYLLFNFNDLPTTSTILSSNLTLLINSSSVGTNLSIFEVNESWNEDTIAYNDQPEVKLNPIFSILSGAVDEIDKFNVTETLNSWFNESLDNNGFMLRTSNESEDSGELAYFSIDSPNSSAWPKLEVKYNALIPNQIMDYESSIINVFNLNNHFIDPDNDEITYSSTPTSNLNIVIDGNNNVSIYALTGFSGTENIIFSANDGVNTTNSNTVQIVVEPPAEDTPPPPPSSGGSKSKTKKKIASINIILDSSRETVSEGEIIEIPIIIENSGELSISGIDLGLISDKIGLDLDLNKYYISSLSVGAQDRVTLTIDSTGAKSESYIISLNADSNSPSLTESAIFVLDVSSGESGAQQELVFVQDYFRNNPECLELQELIEKAEVQIRESNFDEARKNIDIAIESCKNILRTQDERQPKGINLLYTTLIALGILTVLVVLGYAVLKRYQKKK